MKKQLFIFPTKFIRISRRIKRGEHRQWPKKLQTRMSWCVKYENGDQTDLQEQNNCMICIAFTCSLDLYNILDLIVNQTFSITNESFLKVKKHVVPPGCYGCNTITRSRLKLFWSLAIFTLLYSPWNPYNLLVNKNNCFFTENLVEEVKFF